MHGSKPVHNSYISINTKGLKCGGKELEQSKTKICHIIKNINLHQQANTPCGTPALVVRWWGI